MNALQRRIQRDGRDQADARYEPSWQNPQWRSGAGCSVPAESVVASGRKVA